MHEPGLAPFRLARKVEVPDDETARLRPGARIAMAFDADGDDDFVIDWRATAKLRRSGRG